ncbi:hypothetical protein [Streptomyces sp. NPDC055642]
MSESDALAEAERTGEPVEVSARRGESREVFATPEGHLEAREYLRPVWARGQDGWKRVDTDLVVTGEGTVAPKAMTVDVQFSGGGTTAPLVRMRRAGRELSLGGRLRCRDPGRRGRWRRIRRRCRMWICG